MIRNICWIITKKWKENVEEHNTMAMPLKSIRQIRKTRHNFFKGFKPFQGIKDMCIIHLQFSHNIFLPLKYMLKEITCFWFVYIFHCFGFQLSVYHLYILQCPKYRVERIWVESSSLEKEQENKIIDCDNIYTDTSKSNFRPNS